MCMRVTRRIVSVSPLMFCTVLHVEVTDGGKDGKGRRLASINESREEGLLLHASVSLYRSPFHSLSPFPILSLPLSLSAPSYAEPLLFSLSLLRMNGECVCVCVRVKWKETVRQRESA